MDAEWHLVGRDDDLRRLVDVVVHQRRSAVLAGPAGVGKTRLAAECAQRCRELGLAVEWVSATAASATFPFGPLAPLLPTFEPDQAGRVDAKADLLRRFVATLLERAAPRRLAFFVDDAHTLDPASAALVHHLAGQDGVVVIATLRTGEPTPEPVLALWKDGLAERREVTGLPDDALGELLAGVLGGPVDAGLVAALVERSGGNVLFLRELVIGARDSGVLQDVGGLWRLTGALVPSDRLVELVSARLAGLARDELALLELVAVGEPLGTGELSALGDVDIAERLERRGLLLSRTDGLRLTVGFAHPLYGEVVRTQLPALRRRVLARALADAVERSGARRRQDLLRVATWRLDGGGGRPDQMLAAATAARWHYDFELAERLVAVAQAGGAGFEADLLAGQLALLQGRGDEAERQLAALAPRAADDDQRAALALTRIDNLAFYRGRAVEGVKLAEEAEAALTDAGWRDQIQARRSALVFAIDGPRAGAEVATPLLTRAGGRALVWASQVAAFTLGRLGRTEEALAAGDQGYAAHLTVDQPLDWYPWTHLFFRCQILAWAGRLPEADALSEAQYRQALAEGSTEEQAWFAWHRASVVGDRGAVSEAIKHGREAVALFRDLGRPQFMAFCMPYLIEALALGGRTQEATDVLQDFDALGTEDRFMGVDPIRARAWVAVAQGNLPAAKRHLYEAADQGEVIGDHVGRAAALHGLARLGEARRVHEPLQREAERVESSLVAARARHASALASKDPDGLERAARDFENMTAYLLAAEAAADVSVLLRTSSDRRRLAVAERRARELALLCPGATTPALRAVKTRTLLSRAEHEAALLAAAGRSNNEIAAELNLSVRTVEGRLQRAYDRLGVGSRAELAEALRSVPSAPDT